MFDFSSLLYEDFMKYQTKFQKFRLAHFYVKVNILPVSILNDLQTGKAPGKQESYFILRIVFLSSRKTIFGLNPVALLS